MSVFERVRLLGFGLLAVTFLVGGLAGAALDRAVAGDARAEARDARPSGGDRERNYIIDRVDMSDGQRAAIDSILERRVHRMRALWHDVSPQLNAITDSARMEIMEVLTPEQEAQYESLLNHRRGPRDGSRPDSTARSGNPPHDRPGRGTRD